MQIVNILQIPYKATIDLQRRDLTLSDAYGIWLEVKLRLEKIVKLKLSNTALDVKLLHAVEKRFENVFTNPAMKAAIFLDPRYRMEIMRNRDSIHVAKEFILDLNRHLISLKNQNTVNVLVQTSVAPSRGFNIDFDIEAEFNQFWGNNTNVDASKNLSDMESALDAFDPPPMKIKDSILKYWQSDNNEYPEFRNVAKAILAIPPTEIQVERDFSSLKRTLSDLRCKLSTESLQDILTIMLNKGLYLHNNLKQLQNIQKNQV